MNRTALLVIDFINEIVHPNGKIARCAAYVQKHNVISKANHVIDYARSNNWLVIFIKVGFSASYIELPMHSPFLARYKGLNALRLDDWGTEFYAELNYHADDLVVVMKRVSVFYATDLETLLRANQITHLVLCGVSLNMAVEATARDAHDRDYHVTIVADACGALDEERHQQSLGILRWIAAIVNTEAIEKANAH